MTWQGSVLSVTAPTVPLARSPRVVTLSISGKGNNMKNKMETQTMNTKPTHTPGPWVVKWRASETAKYPDGSFREAIAYRVGAAPHDPHIYAEEARDCAVTVAECGENEANARLIAAAPDLLAALRAIIDTDSKPDAFERAEVARAAILRATGVR